MTPFHITLSHIAHHSCISHHTATFHINSHISHQNIPQCITPYYTFELHNSASCTIPRHSAVYSTSQLHSTSHHNSFPYCIITAHCTTTSCCTTFHSTPPHFALLIVPHHHILHITAALYITQTHILHHIQHHTTSNIAHHSYILHHTDAFYMHGNIHRTTTPHHSHQTLLYLALPHHTMFHITPTRFTFHSRLPHLTIHSSFHITPTHSTSHHMLSQSYTLQLNSTLHITAAFYSHISPQHSVSHHIWPFHVSPHFISHFCTTQPHLYPTSQMLHIAHVAHHSCILHHTHYTVFVRTNTG